LPYERLAAWDSQAGNPCAQVLQPWLAEGWRYTDPTTIEVSLRKGVKFHNKPPVNGRELVADDVLFSFQRLFANGLFPDISSKIERTETVDKHSVRIKTKEPMPLLPALFFGAYENTIMAREAGGAKSKFDTIDTAIGTGPFILTEYTPGVGHVAKRNPDYWLPGRPYLDEVRMPIMRDRNTVVAAMQVGKLDYVEELSISFQERIASGRPSTQFLPCVNANPHVIVMNHTVRPFDDVRVRRAISMAVDREGFVKGLFRGAGTVIVTTAPFVEGALTPADLPPEVRKYLEYNPTEAKRLLAEAGFPNGFSLEIFGGLHYGAPFDDQVVALPGMLKAIGINATLKVAGLAEYSQAVASWGYGAMGNIRSGITSGPIIEQGLADYHSNQHPSNNRAAMKDPEYDALVERMLRSVDLRERLSLARQLQIRFVEQSHGVVLPAPTDFNAFSARVKGQLRTNKETFSRQTGLMFRDVWVTD
jgi:peptide/nickel transport system substrate-binding protein